MISLALAQMLRPCVRGLGASAFAAAGLACGVGELPSDSTLRVSLQDGGVEGQWDHRFVFDDGARLEQILVRELKDGARYEISFNYEGDSRPARIAFVPPRTAARQVVSREPFVPALDPRVVWSEFVLAPGVNRVELALPHPWFPAVALVALELRADAGAAAPRVVQGPRTLAWKMDGEVAEAMDGARAQLAQVRVDAGPRRILVRRAQRTPVLDGKLDEAIWAGEAFVLASSLEGEPIGRDTSDVWLAWDDEAVYVAARLRDGDIWGDYRKDDEPLYREEAFEVFFGAGERVHRYLEFQVSPHNVIFDAAFTGHRKGGPEWSGPWGHAVSVAGTLDDRQDRDEEWTVELAFPWSTLCTGTEIPCEPSSGETLRMNIFRLDKDTKGRQSGQALTPTRKPDFHNWDEAAFLTLGDAS